MNTQFYNNVVRENKKHQKQFKLSLYTVITTVPISILFVLIGAGGDTLPRIIAVITFVISVITFHPLIMSAIYMNNEEKYLNSFKDTK